MPYRKVACTHRISEAGRQMMQRVQQLVTRQRRLDSRLCAAGKVVDEVEGGEVEVDEG